MAKHDYQATTPRSQYIHRRSSEILAGLPGGIYGRDDHEATRRAAEEWGQMQREEEAA